MRAGAAFQESGPISKPLKDALQQPGQIEPGYVGTAIRSAFKVKVDPPFARRTGAAGRERGIGEGAFVYTAFERPGLAAVEFGFPLVERAC